MFRTTSLALVLLAALPLGAHANPAHKTFMGLDDAKRNALLASVITASGESCRAVSRNFYQGSDKNGNAFWNAECSNGASFLVMVNNDAAGSTKVMSCAVLKAIDAGECFRDL
jgi:hypothetical protein